MRPRTGTALALLVLAPALVLAAPAAADPPELLTGTVQVDPSSFTPLPDLRHESGPVVHFAYEIEAVLSGAVQAVTQERYTCLSVQDVIRCRGEVQGTLVDDQGEPTGGTTESHVKLTCDRLLFVCEATTHYTGVDDEGRHVVGKGTIQTVGGTGTYAFRQTRP